MLAGCVSDGALAVTSDGDDFDLDVRSFGQRGNLNSRTRRRLVPEIRPVNFIHGLEIAEVRQENR